MSLIFHRVLQNFRTFLQSHEQKVERLQDLESKPTTGSGVSKNMHFKQTFYEKYF